MKYIILLILGFVLCGCRVINYKETDHPDGTIDKKISYNVFGFDTKLGGLTIRANKESKEIVVENLDTSSQNAMGVIGKLVDKVPSYGGSSSTTTVVVPPPVAPIDPHGPTDTRLPPRRPATLPSE